MGYPTSDHPRFGGINRPRVLSVKKPAMRERTAPPGLGNGGLVGDVFAGQMRTAMDMPKVQAAYHQALDAVGGNVNDPSLRPFTEGLQTAQANYDALRAMNVPATPTSGMQAGNPAGAAGSGMGADTQAGAGSPPPGGTPTFTGPNGLPTVDEAKANPAAFAQLINTPGRSASDMAYLAGVGLNANPGNQSWHNALSAWQTALAGGENGGRAGFTSTAGGNVINGGNSSVAGGASTSAAATRINCRPGYRSRKPSSTAT